VNPLQKDLCNNAPARRRKATGGKKDRIATFGKLDRKGKGAEFQEFHQMVVLNGQLGLPFMPAGYSD
jgi:hypothetical protein